MALSDSNRAKWKTLFNFFFHLLLSQLLMTVLITSIIHNLAEDFHFLAEREFSSIHRLFFHWDSQQYHEHEILTSSTWSTHVECAITRNMIHFISSLSSINCNSSRRHPNRWEAHEWRFNRISLRKVHRHCVKKRKIWRYATPLNRAHIRCHSFSLPSCCCCFVVQLRFSCFLYQPTTPPPLSLLCMDWYHRLTDHELLFFSLTSFAEFGFSFYVLIIIFNTISVLQHLPRARPASRAIAA